MNRKKREITSTYHIIVVLHAYDEIEGGIASVHDLVLAMLKEAALVLSPTQALSNELSFQRDPFPHTEAIEVLGKPCLPLLIDH